MRQQLWLNEVPEGTKLTYREHLEKRANDTGEAPPELVRDPIPEAAEYVWLWWCRLHAMRAPGGMGGFAPIGWESIDAFNRLLDLRMVPLEVELLEAIELEFRRHVTDADIPDDDDDEDPDAE